MTDREKEFVKDVHNRLNAGKSLTLLQEDVKKSNLKDKSYIQMLLDGVEHYGMSISEACELLRRMMVL